MFGAIRKRLNSHKNINNVQEVVYVHEIEAAACDYIVVHGLHVDEALNAIERSGVLIFDDVHAELRMKLIEFASWWYEAAVA